jgi:mannose-6-phosphate isomerase
MPGIGRLTGTVKHYDWGGTDYIPTLLNISNAEEKPFAEYWMGVHPQADCTVQLMDGSNYLLRDKILSNPATMLGEAVYKKFGNLPYLFKVLDVRDMLSIQVHPSKAKAEEDFARETKAGIPLNSPQRNYKDDNHKPELMVAMGEFWLLHGFKPEKEMKKTLKAVPELQFLLPAFEQSGYKALYTTVMEMPQDEVNTRLQPLLNRIIPLYKKSELDRSDADYWAAKAALTFSQAGRQDRGIFSVYLFNLVKLEKGEAIFQDAGIPHAYLEGRNVEIMASSDNVLRGGLTTKHIDVKELLKHVKCEATNPAILKGEKRGNETVYTTPAPDFELSSFELQKSGSVTFTPNTAEILLLAEGAVNVMCQDTIIILQTGSPSAIAFPGQQVLLKGIQDSLLFRASVPK